MKTLETQLSCRWKIIAQFEFFFFVIKRRFSITFQTFHLFPLENRLTVVLKIYWFTFFSKILIISWFSLCVCVYVVLFRIFTRFFTFFLVNVTIFLVNAVFFCISLDFPLGNPVYFHFFTKNIYIFTTTT